MAGMTTVQHLRVLLLVTQCFGHPLHGLYPPSAALAATPAVFAFVFVPDIWSIGCLFFEMLTGRPLFPGRDGLDQLSLIARAAGPLPSWMLSPLGGGGSAGLLGDSAKAGALVLPPPEPWTSLHARCVMWAFTGDAGLPQVPCNRAAAAPWLTAGACGWEARCTCRVP